MNSLKRIFEDLKKYHKYVVYSAKADLKSEVASSYLNWLWWILDPLLFMLVYTFISVIVFKSREMYFPIFVFIGLTIWNFFNRIIMSSVKIVKANSAVVSKVYIPKYMLVLQKILVNAFKMIISFFLVIIMMVFFKVPFTLGIFYIIPCCLILTLISFGLGSIVLHYGVFIEDLANVVTILLRLIFYMSGIFYSVETRVPEPFNEILSKLNPIAFIISDLRNVMLYGYIPNYKIVIVWFVISVLISYLGIKIVYKYENSYVKVS